MSIPKSTARPLPASENGPEQAPQQIISEPSTDDDGEGKLQQKFMLPATVSQNIKELAEKEGITKTDLVKKALDNYFFQNIYWVNRVYFLQKENNENFDLSKSTSATQVNVRWTNDPENPIGLSAFVACRILSSTEDTVVINPIAYLPPDMASGEVSRHRSEAVFPKFTPDFQLNTSQPFYLNHLKYEIDIKYIWSMC